MEQIVTWKEEIEWSIPMRRLMNELTLFSFLSYFQIQNTEYKEQKTKP